MAKQKIATIKGGKTGTSYSIEWDPNDTGIYAYSGKFSFIHCSTAKSLSEAISKATEKLRDR